jgi:hypothetical protein
MAQHHGPERPAAGWELDRAGFAPIGRPLPEPLTLQLPAGLVAALIGSPCPMALLARRAPRG